MIVSVHALTLLVVLTTLVELDLARERGAAGDRAGLARTIATTARNTVIHPVVLPVLAGMAWNAGGLPLPPVLDEVLEVLGSAVVPLCLVLIGVSLAYYGVQGRVGRAIALSLLKLLLLPSLVLAFARGGLGLGGLPLAVVVTMAALPIGSNALLFSQRYRTLEPEVTAAVVFSTLGFVVTAPLWLTLLRWLSS
jgi:predicted permease